MATEILHLFVYGTLRKDSAHEMSRVLADNATLIGAGEVYGRLYDLGEYPGLVLASSHSDTVRGEVYVIKEDLISNTLARLDEYEGLEPTESESPEYRREIVQVTMGDNSIVRAWTYIFVKSVQGMLLIPSGDFVSWQSLHS